MVRNEASRVRTLGAYFRQLRIDAQIAKNDLADWLGCGEDRLDRLESYPDGLELLFLVDFAKALDYDPVEVLRACKDILRDSDGGLG